MRLRNKVEPRHYEESLRAIRTEREAETKQAERLSAILAKKAHSVKEKSPTKAA